MRLIRCLIDADGFEAEEASVFYDSEYEQNVVNLGGLAITADLDVDLAAILRDLADQVDALHQDDPVPAAAP